MKQQDLTNDQCGRRLPQTEAERLGLHWAERTQLVAPQFMLVPSLACPSGCSYCFGPHQGPIMSSNTLEKAIEFIARTTTQTGQRRVRTTFHGGEPLMGGHVILRHALEKLTACMGVAHISHKVAIQSNLWLLDHEFCELLCRHTVEIGTSLDGPAEITDRQRGIGYFARTMNGIRKARSWGLAVGCIATFTPASLPRWREVFDFFLAERLGFSIHAAVPALRQARAAEVLNPCQYAELLQNMLDYYIDHRRELSVASLDQICRSVGRGDGEMCTFRNCLGMFLAIDPAGDIYPCQRFCGHPEYRLGSVEDTPTLQRLFGGPVARRFMIRQDQAAEACESCSHLKYCWGGCPYNAWATGLVYQVKDPYCEAYREVFDYVQKRLLDEMQSEENIDAIAESPFSSRGHLLLRKGPLIELVREGPHPSEVARTAKRIVAAAELARGPDLPTVAGRLIQLGVCRTIDSAQASLVWLREQLFPAAGVLNDLYLHVTFNCQLRCSHCYAEAGPAAGRLPHATEMIVSAVKSLIREALSLQFRQVIITGGEPLVHSERAGLLQALADARSVVRPMNLVLRTNLAMPLRAETLQWVALAVDQVVVSIDGTEVTHDARRGAGSYAATVRNLEAYVKVALQLPNPGELSLAAVMPAVEINGEPGDALRRLAEKLGIERIRFRPLLPLGRAAALEEPPSPEALGAEAHPMELIENGFHPAANCGLGQNLYVEPSGRAFPCYAYHQQHAYLGNVIEKGLHAIIGAEAFRALCSCNVDSDPKCRGCELRYLCGGACRAWTGDGARADLNALPRTCEALKQRAMALLNAAQEYLGIPGK